MDDLNKIIDGKIMIKTFEEYESIIKIYKCNIKNNTKECKQKILKFLHKYYKLGDPIPLMMINEILKINDKFIINYFILKEFRDTEYGKKYKHWDLDRSTMYMELIFDIKKNCDIMMEGYTILSYMMENYINQLNGKKIDQNDRFTHMIHLYKIYKDKIFN